MGALAKGALAGSLASVAGLPVSPAMTGPLGAPGVGPGAQAGGGGNVLEAAGSEEAAPALPPVDLDAIVRTPPDVRGVYWLHILVFSGSSSSYGGRRHREKYS